MIRHIVGEIIQKAVMNDQGSTLCGLYFDCQNLKFRGSARLSLFVMEDTHSGEIMLATAAATIHEDIRQTFFVCPVVVVPAQLRPRR